MAICASRLVEYRTRTCFWPGVGRATSGRSSPPAKASSNSKHRTTRWKRAGIAVSEVEVDRDFDESWRQDCQRLQPRPIRQERGVVGEDRARVQRIVDVDRHHRARAAELQDLSHAKVELVDPVAVHRARSDEIDRDVLSAS